MIYQLQASDYPCARCSTPIKIQNKCFSSRVVAVFSTRGILPRCITCLSNSDRVFSARKCYSFIDGNPCSGDTTNSTTIFPQWIKTIGVSVNGCQVNV